MTAPLSTTAAADRLIDPRHPLAAHLRHAASVEEATPHALWTPDGGPLPALFLAHGAPLTFENAVWMRELHDWARTLPKPKAILVVSAHWESDSIGITSTRPTELEYDFSGFAPMYYRLRYDLPDPSELAQQLLAVLAETTSVYEHRNRGLDHGAWLPLKVMYPEADIPVLQLSLPTSDTSKLLALGERLRPLREQGVLVIGSGYVTHGTPFIDFSRPDDVPGWSSEFDLWAADALSRGDVEELANFRTRSPGVRYAHPTVEHFTPLFITLGAATDPTAPVQTAIDGFDFGLSKRSFQAA
jgi:4,5-DOPA dioxygenase extradiol